jgi:hypothetical protein
MKKFVRENLYESFKDDDDEVDVPEEIVDDEDVEVKDDWETQEEDDEIPPELDVDASDMEKEVIEVSDDFSSSEIKDMLDIELELKDFNREEHEFRIIPKEKEKRGKTREIHRGTVMAKLKNDNYVFKLDDGSMRKFNVNDIVMLEEGAKSVGDELNEVMRDGYEYEYVDYLFDIASFLMLNPENVQAILNIHNVVDEEEAKIEITNELEDNDDIYGTKGMYAAGVEAEAAALKIVNQYQG